MGDQHDSSSSDPLVLLMIDWRGCPVVEYVPDKVSGKPSFAGLRLPVGIFVDWVTGGHSIEDFEDGYRVGLNKLRVAAEYLNSDPPVQVADLRKCPEVEFRPDGTPGLTGSGFPVDITSTTSRVAVHHKKSATTSELITTRSGRL